MDISRPCVVDTITGGEWVQCEWPLIPATETVKSMAAQYEKAGFSASGLSRDVLRQKLSRSIAIRKLCSEI